MDRKFPSCDVKVGINASEEEVQDAPPQQYENLKRVLPKSRPEIHAKSKGGERVNEE